MKNKIYYILIFLALTLIGCGLGDKTATFYVSKVVDGDTIELSNGRSVRYIGIDTPELREKKGGRWIDRPEDYALEAKEANRRLVAGKQVRLEFDVVRTDKYKRWLAYVFVGDKLINEELLRQGYASLYTYPPNVKYVERLVAAQHAAREQKKGFWKSYQVISPNQANQCIGEFRTVRGRVLNTFSSAKVTFLNFGQDWRRDFTAVIFNSNLKLFKKQGIDPLTFYKNREVEVVGKIKSYNGPEIIINHPSQITVVGDGE